MEEQHMKRLFSIILMTLLGFMTKAWADNISIENGKIAPNSTKIVSVVLNNTATNYVGFQMDFYLPKGLSIDKSKTTLTDRAESGSSITIGKQSNGAFRLVYSSLNLTPIKGTGGALINLCLKASADYSGGSIMVKNVVFGTTDSKTVRMDNVSFDMQRMTFVTVTANTIKMKYGDVVPELTYQKSDPSVKGTPTLSCEATSTSPVGTYPIVISKGSIEADEVKFVNGSLIIEKAPLTVSAGNYTKKQGDPMPVFKAVYNGFKNNETEDVLTKKPVITTTATEASAPGSYPVTVSGAEAQNYDISYKPGTLTVTEADAVIITAKSYSRAYGDNNPTFEYEVQGAQLDGVPEITCEATKGSPVGTYAIVVKQGTVKNYNMTFANGTLTVTKAPLTVSAGNYTKKQGDPMPEFKASYQGFKNNETEDVLTKKPVIMTTATESSAPGEYPVTVSGAEAQNYDINYQSGTLSVTEADAVIITAKSYSRTYGDNNPTFEYEVQGAQLDGVPEITCEATKGSPVGTYAIVVKQGTVKNYNVTFANGTLTVTKAPLIISVGTYTKRQGDPMPEFKAAYDGFKNNETEDVLTKKPVIMTTATESSAPGEYPVTVSGAEAQNYDISYQPGTLTVTEAEVSDPVITLNGNELNISCSTARAIIYYTLNGNSPDENSSVYTEPVSLEASCQIKAIAKSFGVASNVVSTEYHNPQYPDIIKVGDVFTANIINNGVGSLPMYFKVTSVYPFEASLVKKEDYVEGWSNENISGDIEVPSEIICAGTKLRVTEIGGCALSSCTHTGLIKLNEGLKTIRGDAFRWSAIKELFVPNSVKRIEGGFITECHSLKTITLGTGLQSLGTYAFWYVDGLRYIYSLNPIPPKFDDPNNSFDDTPVDQITLYVPIGSKSAYENAPGWNLFAGRIVEIDPTGIADVTTDGLSITVSNHHIHVEGAKVGCFLNVYDLSGNKCMSVRITSGKVNINCNVPNGVYVVRLGNVSKKVVL
ncbi:MAG: chitobiase/beta-hexosaminidase C-terminal domain-containing protein [Prevotella sp.]|nr:chitobiase/beta-hexosaminidase C-terminal domain-containing protein [Prevotella sp.]